MATRDQPRLGWTVVLCVPYPHLHLHHQPPHVAHMQRATDAG